MSGADEMRLFRERLLSRMISREELEGGINGIEDVSERAFGIVAKSGAAPEFILLLRMWAELATRQLPHIPEANRAMALGKILNLYEMADRAKDALDAFEAKANAGDAAGNRDGADGGVE